MSSLISRVNNGRRPSASLASTDTTLNREKGSLSWRFSLPEMSTEEFLRTAAKHLSTFSSVFGPILQERLAGTPGRRPGVAMDASQAPAGNGM